MRWAAVGSFCAEPSWELAEPRSDRRERNGLIFVCDQSTEEECLSRRLLGLPKSQSTLLAKMREVHRTPWHTRRLCHLFSAFGGRAMCFPRSILFTLLPHLHLLRLPDFVALLVQCEDAPIVWRVLPRRTGRVGIAVGLISVSN